jgi:hypothetical protein
VTNPAIDPFREAVVTSLRCFIGPEGDITTTEPTHARVRDGSTTALLLATLVYCIVPFWLLYTASISPYLALHNHPSSPLNLITHPTCCIYVSIYVYLSMCIALGAGAASAHIDSDAGHEGHQHAQLEDQGVHRIDDAAGSEKGCTA